MKKRSKILASLVLAGTMVLGLAGCGDSGSANGGTQSGKNSDAKYHVRYLPSLWQASQLRVSEMPGNL